jgi:phosphate transport system substrate-binding protein
VKFASIQANVKVDPELPEYKAAQAFKLKIIGSDTMKNEMAALMEGFTKFYPNVGSEIEGKGSASAPPALLAGTAQFAPMSRGMNAREVDEFKKKFGYPPVALPTSIDMLEVYVHKDNPIQGLTMQQVDAMFSRTRKGGYAKAINTWGDLGLPGEWADKPIMLYGRNKISGTHKFFLEHALFNGAFRDEVKEQSDSDSVVGNIASDKYAIGYSGMGYKTANVRALPLALDYKSPYIVPEPANAYSGDYPLTRVLLLYVNHQPGTELDPLRREFIRYLYSQQGQADVLRSGYLPVGNHTAIRALTSVQLKP